MQQMETTVAKEGVHTYAAAAALSSTVQTMENFPFFAVLHCHALCVDEGQGRPDFVALDLNTKVPVVLCEADIHHAFEGNHTLQQSTPRSCDHASGIQDICLETSSGDTENLDCGTREESRHHVHRISSLADQNKHQKCREYTHH